jgi:hypothetical protein
LKLSFLKYFFSPIKHSWVVAYQQKKSMSLVSGGSVSWMRFKANSRNPTTTKLSLAIGSGPISLQGSKSSQ